jgi:hypothetical protein
MKKKNAILGSVMAAMFALAASANAGVVFTVGNNPQSDEQNILFNGAGTVAGPATTVIGRTNQTSTLVSFMSSENLVTVASGQSRIEAQDGAFTDLSIFLTAGGTFGDLIFNLNTPNRETGNATITVNLLSGPAQTYDFGLSNGENFLTVVANGGDRITSIGINSNTGMTSIGIDDARQIRISGIGSTDVPEPGTLALFAAGLIGIQRLARRSNKQRS